MSAKCMSTVLVHYLCDSTPQICTFHFHKSNRLPGQFLQVSHFPRSKHFSTCVPHTDRSTLLPLHYNLLSRWFPYQYSPPLPSPRSPLEELSSISRVLSLVVINGMVPSSLTIFFLASCHIERLLIRQQSVCSSKLLGRIRLDRCVVNTDQGYTGNGPREPLAALRDRPPSPLALNSLLQTKYVIILYVIHTALRHFTSLLLRCAVSVRKLGASGFSKSDIVPSILDLPFADRAFSTSRRLSLSFPLSVIDSLKPSIVG